MAGRYVILEFDDRDQADLFVDDEATAQAAGFRTIAMYLKPRAFCDCPEGKTRVNVANWRKHRKFGLYVCRRCGKPSPHHESGIIGRLQYVFGFNLLPTESGVER